MSSKLGDLNEHLFAQLDRLFDADLAPEKLEAECARAKAIVALSDQVIGNANTQLKAAELFGKHGKGVLPMLPEIGASKTIEGEVS
jgi:hypothetical protein